MIKIKDIYEHIDKIAPFETAIEGDNSGLFIVEMNEQVSGIIVALDATKDVIMQADQNKANLIITHHPIIFRGLEKIEKNSTVYQAIQKGISVISAHTNMDAAKGGVNDILATLLNLQDVKVLENTDNMGRIGKLKDEMNIKDLINLVTKKLNTNVRATKTKGTAKKIALLGGGGGDYWEEAKMAGADTFITGESKQHILLSAKEHDFLYIDAGHFATESPVCFYIKDTLKAQFPSIDIKVANQKAPYEVY